MKINLNRSIIALFFVLYLSSCLKDNTNTNFTDVILPDSIIFVNVTDPENLNPKTVKLTEPGANFMASFDAYSGEELKIEANVFYEGPYEISYEWLLDNKIISTEKVLSLVPSKAVIITLNVKRGEDKAGCDYKLNLNITHPYASGLFVMGKESGKVILDFFRYSTNPIKSDLFGTMKEYKLPQYAENADIFPIYNDHDLPCTDPIDMQWIKSKNAIDYGFGIQMVDKDYHKSVTIMAASIKENAKLSDEWIETPGNFTIKSMSNLRYSSILVSEEGDTYMRTNYDYGAPNTGRFSSTPLGFNDPNDTPDMGWQKINVTQHCRINLLSTISLLYEKSKSRFLALLHTVDAYNADNYPDQIEIMKFPGVTLGNGKVDLNNFDKDILYIFNDGGTNISMDGSNFEIIYKDGDDIRIQRHKIEYSVNDGLLYSIVSNSVLSAPLSALLKTNGVQVYKDVDMSSRKGEIYVAAGKKLFVSNMTGSIMEEIGTFDNDIIHFKKTALWTTSTAPDLNYFSGKVCALGFANGDFKIVKFYKDPNKPGQILQEILAEKNYNGGFVDSKCINNNVIMGY